MKTCSTCKHWDMGQNYYAEHNVRECRNVPMLWESHEWTEDSDGRVLKAKYKDTKAFVQDGSDYSATFYTKAEFGCNQWESV